jgi:hypothetical protein
VSGTKADYDRMFKIQILIFIFDLTKPGICRQRFVKFPTMKFYRRSSMPIDVYADGHKKANSHTTTTTITISTKKKKTKTTTTRKTKTKTPPEPLPSPG